MSEPKHVYDWLDESPINNAEKDAKEWLGEFLKPAIEKRQNWLDCFRVSTEWRGKRYTCSGASRLGDVWLRDENSDNFYDHRVNVEECGDWKRVRLPIK